MLPPQTATALLLAALTALASPASALPAVSLADALSPISGYVDGTSAQALAQVLSVSYTHTIVGGGNAGLALAARLSENASNSVLVIEAGTHQPANPGILIPAQASSTFLSDIDWAFFTVPQTNANNRKVYTPRGKVLGGSSALNFMAWTRGFAAEYTAWATLAGSKAWTFNNLLPFFKQSETFTAPGPTQLNNVTRLSNPSTHGTSGPVDASYPPFVSPQFTGFFSSLTNLSVAQAQDLSDGNNAGVSWSAQSVDPATETRATSDTAYIAPIAATRSNLVILTSAQATRILWSNNTATSNLTSNTNATSAAAAAARKPAPAFVTAAGVEFSINGQLSTVQSTGEVILSAGSIQSPQLLELSGVGDPKILTPLGINTVVNLPGVGANLQDHPAVVNVYKLKPGFTSLDTLAGASLAEAVAEYATGQGILTQELSTLAYVPANDFLNSTDKRTAVGLLAKPNSKLPLTQQAAMSALFLAGAPQLEFLPINVYFGATTGEPGVNYISLATCLQHSFSRGTIHISSSDPLAPPAIDPAYLQHPLDGFLLAKGAQFMRKATQSPAFAQFIDEETEPGPQVQSDADFAEWVKGDVRTEYHPVGTASMLPRGQNGVVDPNLLVYGTSNVRVVDLSVVPLHLSTHPQSVAYAIAEKAATIINGA